MYQQVPVLLLKPVQALRRVLGLVLAGAPRGERAQEPRPLSRLAVGRCGGSWLLIQSHGELTKSMTPLVSGHLKPVGLQGPAVH